jgi:hypothetical protein
MGILGGKPKNDELLGHWVSFVDGFNMSPQEFYDTVEKELAARKVPGLEMSRVEYAEGGLLSDRRLYLRMLRERLAFDTCAAPFGTGFFFSCRTVHSPPVVKVWQILVLLYLLQFIFSALFLLLGFKFAIVAFVSLLFAVGQVFQNALAVGLSDLDRLLMKTPVIGPMYERWIRKETYYREDTRLVYLKIVPEIIRVVADEVTGAKGVKLLDQYQRAPILGELYKPMPPSQSAK